MKHLFGLSVAAAVCTFAAPAIAQDAAPQPVSETPDTAPQPVPGPAYGSTSKAYNGLYVGVSGGYDLQSNDVGSIVQFDRNGDGNFSDAVTTAAGANAFSTGFCNGRARDAVRLPTGCERDRNRPSYYGRVGIDRQYGPIVVGVVGEFGRTEIVDYVSAFSTTPASYVFSRKVDWEASARLRAGFAAQETLFYATGGIGYARLKHGFTTTNATNSFSTLLDDRDRKGFIVGGGIEHRFMQHFSFGLEYSYHDYKDSQYLIRATQGTAAATNPFVLAPFTAGTTLRRSDDNFRWHSLRATLGYHF